MNRVYVRAPALSGQINCSINHLWWWRRGFIRACGDKKMIKLAGIASN